MTEELRKEKIHKLADYCAKSEIETPTAEDLIGMSYEDLFELAFANINYSLTDAEIDIQLKAWENL